MLIAHEPAWLVGTNRQECQIHASDPFANVAEVFPVTRIARKIDLWAARAQEESAPKGAIAVTRATTRPVLCRGEGNCRVPRFHALPPVELVHRVQAELLEKSSVPEAGDESRRVHFLETQECFDIEVVVVIVRDEHQMDRWQLLKRKAGITDAFRADATERTGALRINRIGQYIEARELQQKRDVIDEGERDLTGCQRVRQRRARTVVDPLRPQFALPCPLPAQKILEGTSGLHIRVE